MFAGCSVTEVRAPSQSKPLKYGLYAQPLSLDNRALQSSKSFWKIIPYYRGQRTNSSCSLASATIVMNAIVPSHTLSASSKLFTERRILNISNSRRWERATATNGTGISLKQMHKELDQLLINLKLENTYDLQMKRPSKSFRKSLKKMEVGDYWIIVNFDQGMVMGEKSVGHFSPIGAYDEASDRVLILDTDAEWYEPYWVSVDLLLKSMDTSDSLTGKRRGYLILSKKNPN